MRYSIPASAAGARLDVAATNKVLRNAYLLLALSFLPSVAGAFLGAAFPILMASPMLAFFVFLGAIIGLQTMVIKNQTRPAGIGWLFALTFVMGFFIGPMLGFALNSFSNGAQLVGVALGGTAAIFFVIAGYATVTRRDFSQMSMGKSIFIGMIGIIGVSIVNYLFLQMPAVSMAISSIVIILMSVLILHTVNRVVRGGETNYIMVAMTLYIALFNIFQSLLHLLMAFAGNRD